MHCFAYIYTFVESLLDYIWASGLCDLSEEGGNNWVSFWISKQQITDCRFTDNKSARLLRLVVSLHLC